MDEDLGKLLKLNPTATGASTDHADEEAIAALMDGRVSAGERRSLVDHIGGCSECYSIFSESMRLVQMLEEGQPVAQRGTIFGLRYAFPLAAAAVLVILFSIVIALRQSPSPAAPAVAQKKQQTEPPIVQETPGSVQPPGEESALNRDYLKIVSRYRNATMEEQGMATEYGFSGALRPEKAAFRIGRELVDLQVALNNKNRLAASTQAATLAALLKSVPGGDKLAASYQEMNGRIQNTQLELPQEPQANLIEALLAEDKLEFQLKSGEWVSCGMLAAINLDRSYFSAADIDYLIGQASQRQLPRGARLSLEEMKTILQKDQLSDRDFKKLNSLLSDLSQLLS